ncbi:hypothetical protein WN943_029711 [Citrus x changshan-huyou]
MIGHLYLNSQQQISNFITRREKEEMASECRGNSSWPELLGAQGVEAAATVERENTLVNAQIVLEGSFVTGDFLCTRVRVWVNTRGTVTRVPTIG